MIRFRWPKGGQGNVDRKYEGILFLTFVPEHLFNTYKRTVAFIDA